MLRANLAHDPVQVRRFLNEAKAACQLSHPHTVRVFDFGQTDDKLLYMAMERLNGRELSDVLREDAPLEPFRAVHIAIGVLKSLAEAHAAGLVHRDLKPGNIFLCDIHGEPDFVKLIDFGIAKSYDGDDPEHDLTKTGFAVGTPKYMSPEQGRAEPLDGRSDLYSLGVILYEALTGAVPFKASSAMSMIVKHMQEPPPDIAERVPSDLPEGLRDVVMRSLAKDPWDRFSDADDMRAELEEMLERSGRPVSSRGRAVSAKMRAIPSVAGGVTGDTVPGGVPTGHARSSSAADSAATTVSEPPPAEAPTLEVGTIGGGGTDHSAPTLRVPTGPQAAAPAPALDLNGDGTAAAAAPSEGEPAADEATTASLASTSPASSKPGTAGAVAADATTLGAVAGAAGATVESAADATATERTAAGALDATTLKETPEPATKQVAKTDAPSVGAAATGPGVHTRLVQAAAQPSVTAGSPTRPGRNRSEKTRDREGGGGKLAVAVVVVLALLGGGYALTRNSGESPVDTLAAKAVEVKAKVGSAVREPLQARTGTRERVKPRLAKGSKLKKEVDEFHEKRFEGVGERGKPLSTKEIDATLAKTRRNMIACVRRHGSPDTAYKRIGLDIEVNQGGRVQQVEVKGDLAEGKLGECISGVAQKVRFRSTLPAKQSFDGWVSFQPTKGNRPTVKKRRRRSRPVGGAKPKRPTYNGDEAL